MIFWLWSNIVNEINELNYSNTIPFEKCQYARVVIQLVELVAVIGQDQIIEGLNVIEVPFAHEEVVLNFPGLLLDYRHGFLFSVFIIFKCLNF